MAELNGVRVQYIKGAEGVQRIVRDSQRPGYCDGCGSLTTTRISVPRTAEQWYDFNDFPYRCDKCVEEHVRRVGGVKWWHRDEVLRRWPRLTAHLICQSLGYFTPSSAACCIADYKNGQDNYCEYLMACWKCKPLGPIRLAISGRHHHEGFMAHYPHAKEIVDHAIATGDEPLFASWF